MIKNTMKAIEEAHKMKIDPKYDMYCQNVVDIMKNSSDSVGAILNSFAFGYAQGMKAAKAEMKKQAKAVTI